MIVLLFTQDVDKSENTDEVKQAMKSHIKWPAVIIICTLLHKPTGKSLVIGNTHLSWTEFQHPDISCIQVSWYLD